jgi:hypothetical protein
MTNADMRCRLCGGTPSRTITVREMMYGTGELFDYFACSSCGCLQIARIPDDFAPYYPGDYYSLSPAHVRTLSFRRLAARWAIERRGGQFWPRPKAKALTRRSLSI